MDGLSAAASGMAVVSLAVQLAGTVKKLHDFWDSMKEAPDEISAIVKDLKLLSSVLANIEQNEQTHGPDPTITSILESCADKVKALVAFVNEFEPEFTSASRRVRKWNAFRATLRSGRLKAFRASLDETKVSLMLAQQCLSNRLVQINYRFQQEAFSAITQRIAGHQMQHFSRNVTTIATDPLDIDGHVADLRSEIQRIANMMPNPFLRSGFVTAMDNSVETWSRNLTAQSVRRPSVKATCPKDHIDTRTRATEEDPPNDGDVTKVNAAKAVVESHWKRPRIELWGSRYSSETENMFGKIYYTSRTFEEQASSSNDLGFSDYKYEFETSFTLHPAQWLIKCGLNFAIRAAISQSVRGWKHNLEVHRAVPDDSVIFDLCEQGNIDGVRTLLASGKASVRDTNSWGRTPLHFAAKGYHVELCKLLLRAGSDPGRRDFRNCSSLLLAAYASTTDYTDKITTLRLFQDPVEFCEGHDDGWHMLRHFARGLGETSLGASAAQCMAWALRYFRQEISQNVVEGVLSHCFSMMAVRMSQNMLELIGLLLDATPRWTGISTLWRELLMFQDFATVKFLMEKGADPHLLDPDGQTPTCMVIRTPRTFLRWRNGLVESGFDIAELVRHELEVSPLAAAGWEQDTLLDLFTHDFASISDLDKVTTGQKCDFVVGYPEWELLLARIRKRQAADTAVEVHKMYLSLSYPPCLWCLYTQSLEDEKVAKKVPLTFGEGGIVEEGYSRQAGLHSATGATQFKR